MNRRSFLEGGVLLLGGVSLSGSAQTNAVAPHRTARLFNKRWIALESINHVMPCVDESIICIHGETRTFKKKITATTVAGQELWELALPSGIYRAVSGDAHSGTVLLYGTISRDQGGLYRGHSILKLDIASGTTEVLAQLPTPASPLAVLFMGNLWLIRLLGGIVEIWRTSDGVSLESTINLTLPTSPTSFVLEEMSRRTLAAMIAVDGSVFSTISVPNGNVNALPIPPQISEARGVLSGLIAKSSLPGGGTLATPRIVAATGNDGTRPRFYALVFPINTKFGHPAPVVAVDVDLTSTLCGYCDLRSGGIPIKILRAPGELGIANSNGDVCWYPALV